MSLHYIKGLTRLSDQALKAELESVGMGEFRNMLLGALREQDILARNSCSELKRQTVHDASLLSLACGDCSNLRMLRGIRST